MSKCPFLSTYEAKVSCFDECPFYNCSGVNEICPFRASIKEKSLDKNIFYEYDLIKNESTSFLDELYENNQYLKILQL